MEADIVMAIWYYIKPESLMPLPENIRIAREVDQEELLRGADLAIFHAGMNTVLDCLMLGVPMVLWPRDADQYGNARRVAELGAGVRILDDSPKTIRLAAETVLSDGSYRRKAAELGEKARACAGAGGAADWALSLIAEGIEYGMDQQRLFRR